MERLTYRSVMGDYGIDFNPEGMEDYAIICKLANRLGKYEDLNMTPDELRELIDKSKT